MSDMTIDGWHIEKISKVMEALVNMAEDFLERAETDEADRKLRSSLSYALANSTKLYLSMQGKQAIGTDYIPIMERGRDAFEELRLAHGLRRGLSVQDCIEQITRLLPQGPSSRTQMFDLLAQCVTRKSPFLSEANALVDKRAMGELKWDEFVALMSDLLLRHQSPLSEETT